MNGEVVIHAQERKNEKLKKQNFGLRFILKARVRAECGDSATSAACDESAARVRRECGESADCCHSFVRRIGSPNLKCSCSAN